MAPVFIKKLIESSREAVSLLSLSIGRVSAPSEKQRLLEEAKDAFSVAKEKLTAAAKL